MSEAEFFALFGGILAAFLLRFFNIMAEWLARVLKVDEPEPIVAPTHTHTPFDHHGTTPIESESNRGNPAP